MQRQAVHPFIAPQDVTDLHQMVVDDVGQVIGRNAIRFHQDRVLQDGILKGDIAPDEVVDGDVAVQGHLESQRVVLAAGRAPGCLIGIQIAAQAVVTRIPPLALQLFGAGFQPLGCAEAAVGGPGIE